MDSALKDEKWTPDNTADSMGKLLRMMGPLKLSPALLSAARVVPADEVAPAADDTMVIGGESYPKYPTHPDTGRMSAETVAAFVKATALATKCAKANSEKERLLLVEIYDFMSPVLFRNLKNLDGSAAAMATHDIYTIWPFIMKASSSVGAQQSIDTFKELTTLSMSGTYADHADFAVRFNTLLTTFKANFEDPQHPGFVKIDVLASMIYLKAVDQVIFKFLIDKTLTSMSDLHSIVKPSELTDTFQQFWQNSGANLSVVSETAIGYSASVDAKSMASDPPAVLCATCKKRFFPARKRWKFCSTCAAEYANRKGKLAVAPGAEAMVASVVPSAASSQVTVASPPLFTAAQLDSLSPQTRQMVLFDCSAPSVLLAAVEEDSTPCCFVGQVPICVPMSIVLPLFRALKLRTCLVLVLIRSAAM